MKNEGNIALFALSKDERDILIFFFLTVRGKYNNQIQM